MNNAHQGVISLLAICLFSAGVLAQPTTGPSGGTTAPTAVKDVKLQKPADYKKTLDQLFPKSAAAPTTKEERIQVKPKALTDESLKALAHVLKPGEKHKWSMREWAGVMGSTFKTNDELFATLFTANLIAELTRVPTAEYKATLDDAGKTLAALGLNLSSAQLAEQVKLLRANKAVLTRLLAGRTQAAFPGTPDAILIDVGTVALQPSVIGTINEFIPELCKNPITEDRYETLVEKCFDLIVKVPYPCGVKVSWSGVSIKWCRKNVNLGDLCFRVGCEEHFKLNCCGASATGSCSAQACLSGYCAGCSGQINTSAGVSTPNSDGLTCNYGLSASVGVSCKIGGLTVYSVTQQLSPYSTLGPCPPPLFCP